MDLHSQLPRRNVKCVIELSKTFVIVAINNKYWQKKKTVMNNAWPNWETWINIIGIVSTLIIKINLDRFSRLSLSLCIHLHTVMDQYRTFLSLLCFACSGRTQYINKVHALDQGWPWDFRGQDELKF